MKKALTAILALSLIFLAACGTGSAAAGSAGRSPAISSRARIRAGMAFNRFIFFVHLLTYVD